VKLRTRLVLFGAVLPLAALLAALLLAGYLFRADQLADLDRRLLAQAAVESVGLFDGPEGRPHTHVDASPIADDVKDFSPATAIFDGQGRRVTDPEAPATPTSLPFRGPLVRVGLATTEVGGVERRVLELPLRAPDGGNYTLWLGASLAPLERSLSRFYRATFLALGALALCLLVVQIVVARRMAARVDVMTAFLPRLDEGAVGLASDPIRDELGALRETLRSVAQRLWEAKGEQDRLLASAAHELRTPLTVIRTEIDLALRRERPSEELRDALRSVRAEVQRLAELAGALLDLQAVRHLGFARSDGDLGALVREAVSALSNVAEAAEVELRIVGVARAPARYDERALRQAVDNVVVNALKHAPRATAVEVSLERAGERWVIAVSDQGPGIPAPEVERVFEPFHRVSPTGTGAGLGLAIVREVVERHGGRVFVDLAHAPGARLVIELPDG